MDGDKDSLLLDGGFFFLIVVRLIRDNWKAVIENYPTSLICEIWFDLQDMGSYFGPIFGDVIKGLLLVLGSFLIPFWACVLGLRT